MVHVIVEIDFGGTVAMGVFGQYFVFALHPIMNLDTMAHRAK
jgi:hypothetical protein